jgi:predicted dehydrogenase
VDLIAVSRPDLELAAKLADEFGASFATSSWEEALEAGLDVVVVASPPAAHEQQVCAALEAGCHVLCEKPFATTSHAAQAMVSAAKANDRRLLVSFGWPLVPFFERVRKLVADEIGAVEHASMHLEVAARAILSDDARVNGADWAFSSAPETYRDPTVSGGGSAAVSMSHELGLLIWALGRRIESLHATTFPIGSPLDLHDAVGGRLHGGASLAVSCASGHPKPGDPEWQLFVYGTTGQIHADSRRGTIEIVNAQGQDRLETVPESDCRYDPQATTKHLVDVAIGSPVHTGLTDELALDVVRLTELIYSTN